MLSKPSQEANASTLIEAKKRSSFVISIGSNIGINRSAVITFHMAFIG
jgi:hypothetical protein